MNRKSQNKAYTSRLQKGGALLEDMRVLVRVWNNGGNDGQRDRVIVENVLGKKTRVRAGDIYRRAFSHRFLKGDPPDAWKIFRPLEDREVPVEILRPVYLWITAHSEALLYDFTSEEILPKTGIRIDMFQFAAQFYANGKDHGISRKFDKQTGRGQGDRGLVRPGENNFHHPSPVLALI